MRPLRQVRPTLPKPSASHVSNPPLHIVYYRRLIRTIPHHGQPVALSRPALALAPQLLLPPSSPSRDFLALILPLASLVEPSDCISRRHGFQKVLALLGIAS
jgi:hypothetical protein